MTPEGIREVFKQLEAKGCKDGLPQDMMIWAAFHMANELTAQVAELKHEVSRIADKIGIKP